MGAGETTRGKSKIMKIITGGKEHILIGSRGKMEKKEANEIEEMKGTETIANGAKRGEGRQTDECINFVFHVSLGNAGQQQLNVIVRVMCPGSTAGNSIKAASLWGSALPSLDTEPGCAATVPVVREFGSSDGLN